MNPRFPVYVVSKGRHESRVTVRALERMRVPYRIVVEAAEFDAYASVINRRRILVLDPAYQRDYDTFDDLGDTKGKGPGPARNFCWDHAVSIGAKWHWVMDDNLNGFWRLNHNLKVRVGDGTILRCMEDFVLRYRNIGMAGPNYYMFASRKNIIPAFTANTRIYSCNLIRNDVPFRWRGRYNEDTDLSLRMLKAGWCTVLFNAFLQWKMTTQTLGGGNTAEFYAREGTRPKSEMLVKMHPDVARLAWRFGRAHHHVNYKPFRGIALIPRAERTKRGVNNYGMRLVKVPPKVRAKA